MPSPVVIKLEINDNIQSVLVKASVALLSIPTACYVGYNWYQQRKLRQKYDTWSKEARNTRDTKDHSRALGISAKELPLYSAIETNQKIKDGTLNATDNVVALAQRCRRLGRLHNAVAEELYQEAVDAAATAVKGSSPLAGVPISVKEHLCVKGCYATGGLQCRLKHRQAEDSLVVSILRKGGAIPLCTGNVMQLMMLAESDNRTWGRVGSAWDPSRVAGGSSGGDGALVGLGCVPIALGSDVAGSIRIPAASNGVIGFKPTSKRISGRGTSNQFKDDRAGMNLTISVSFGPIARSVDDCAAMMKSVWVPELFDQDRSLPRLPFSIKQYEQTGKKFKIAYFKTDDWFEPCVTAKRAVNETIEKLRVRGHLCSAINPPTNGWKNYSLVVAVNSADGKMRSFRDGLQGEAFLPHYNTLCQAAMVPDWLRPIVSMFLDKRRAHLLSLGRLNGIGVYNLWQYTADILAMKAAWAEMIKDYDAVIYPAVPIPPPPHGLTGEITCAYSYVMIANLLDWPSGAVPVTTVREDECHYNNCPHGDFYTRIVRDKVMPGSAGLPVSVSITAGAYEDEACLAVMKEVEQAVSFTAKPPSRKKG